MIQNAVSKIGAVAAIFMLLVSCGNAPGQTDTIKAYSGMISLVKPKQKAQAKPDPNQLIALVLEKTPGRAMLAIVEKSSSIATLVPIETNNGYETWATADRVSITTKSGFVTATRGLGQDIMSSEIGPAAALVAARKPGSAQRTMRFLGGENKVEALAVSCSISRDAEHEISVGEVNEKTILMREKCSGGAIKFENLYMVGNDGYPVQSRVWSGTRNEYLTLQLLRR